MLDARRITVRPQTTHVIATRGGLTRHGRPRQKETTPMIPRRDGRSSLDPRPNRERDFGVPAASRGQKRTREHRSDAGGWLSGWSASPVALVVRSLACPQGERARLGRRGAWLRSSGAELCENPADSKQENSYKSAYAADNGRPPMTFSTNERMLWCGFASFLKSFCPVVIVLGLCMSLPLLCSLHIV
jgi:hypothetical protein